MLYRELGKTKEKVSALGFGCMRLPQNSDDSKDINIEESIRMVRYAIDQGLSYIDTAYPYHGGMSEPFVAKALADGYRDKVKLATKLPSWLVTSREDMDRLLNEQLTKLNTDHIDFYLVHALNQGFWDNLTKHGIFEFLDSAIADGRIKYAGFSFHDELPLFKEIVDAYDWSFCQIQLNYIDETYQAGREGMAYARAKGLGIVIMEPLRGGNLVRSIPTEVQEAFDSGSVKRTPAEWAFRWLYNDDMVDVILSGMSTMDQVVENLKTASEAPVACLTAEESALMEKAKKAFRARIQVDCTGCAYCMPCPNGVLIPNNFSLFNEYHLFDEVGHKNWQKGSYQSFSVDEKASACVECGLCESHCPQNLPIIEDLKRVAAVLGA